MSPNLTGLIILISLFTATKSFPSSSYGWILPGIYEAPTYQQTFNYLNDKSMTVEQWELHYGDLAYGTDYGTKHKNEQIDVLTLSQIYSQLTTYISLFLRLSKAYLLNTRN